MTADLLAKGYTRGTHRLVAPEVTLARVAPWLDAMGITRIGDITGLDCLGIPTYCAMRPPAKLVQVANGKGLMPVEAKVSAVMEAIEVYHAEEPRLPLTSASLGALRAAGRQAVDPAELPGFQASHHFDERFVVDWVEAEELHSGARVLVPASAAYPTSPSLYDWWTNGLASGNHVGEATLHALYEAIERHALALAVQPDPDPLAILRPRGKYLRLSTITSPPVQDLCECVARAGTKLVLAWVRSPVPVHTFWAVLLDHRPSASTTRVTIGYGTHVSPTVAAIRAITEAAQSRLSMIHASREDLTDKPAFVNSGRLDEAYTFFDGLISSADWRGFADDSRTSLSEDYARLLAALYAAGLTRIYRVDLSRAPFDIPVVKVLVPGLSFDERWM